MKSLLKFIQYVLTVPAAVFLNSTQANAASICTPTYSSVSDSALPNYKLTTIGDQN